MSVEITSLFQSVGQPTFTTLLADFLAAHGDVNMPDKDGMTLLRHTAACGARPGIRMLVASGKCDYLLTDNKGRYAFELAIEWSRDYAVGRLLSKHQAILAYQRGVPAYVPRAL